ncbi:MAG: DUF4890 domain-containing protein [Planctomycetaceae bacterium]|jgi:Spy/CpxP family protein refolding chaperone|nr:DUF4890 domain-containing protein [Planctomycetaceae bacterium]
MRIRVKIFTIMFVGFVAVFFAQFLYANKPSEAERFEIFIKTDGLVKALDLTSEQVEKLKAAVDKSYFPHGRNGKPGVDPPPAEGFKMDDDFRTEIYKILTPKQKQLVLTYKFQLDGGFNANALYTTKLEVFNLTGEQQKKLQELEVERSGKYQEIFKNAKLEKPEEDIKKLSNEERKTTMEKIHTKMKEIAADYNKKMKSVLTKEQIELGNKLTNEGKGLREKVGLKAEH